MDIDIGLLSSLNLTPNQYAIASSIYKKDSDLYNYLVISLGYEDLSKDISKLIVLRFIHNRSEEAIPALEQLSIRQSFIDTVEIQEESAWNQFVIAYPRKEGMRPLHNNKEECKKKYISLVKNNKRLHDTILKSIENEMEDRKQASYKREFRPAWKYMSTYINQRGWEMYKGEKKDLIEEESVGRITRRL